MCESNGNNILVELENIFWIAYRNEAQRTFPDLAPGTYQVTLGKHYKILAAVEARNVELAQQLMADHFEGFKKYRDMMNEKKTE
ncbi:MAG: FCD domain-containing protein [bacterium]|nr:FCD domain-containing protein [bacterium]